MEKRCFKCLGQKPLASFYRHSCMADGHLNKCIDCTKDDVKKHRLENLERIRAYDKLRASAAHRVQARKDYAQTPAGRLAHARALRVQRLRYPDRAKARYALSNAVRDGRIRPWPVCAVPECTHRPEGHHPDYSRPLDVVWLCNTHHREVHQITETETA